MPECFAGCEQILSRWYGEAATEHPQDAHTWFCPLPIAWILVETDTGDGFIETATCFYNGASDGNRRREGTGPAMQLYQPALALGFPNGLVAACLRRSGEATIHTATWQHRRRICQLLRSAPRRVAEENLRASPGGVRAKRVEMAPVAFTCKLLRELPLGSGQVGFILSIVGVHVAGELIIDGQVESSLLRPIGACDPRGNRFFAAREEHTMIFPSEHDSAGHLIVPESTYTLPRVGMAVGRDVEYEPPYLPALPHNPFKALIVPRPIGWISTRGEHGDNLSPYSFFGYLAPDVVFFGVGGSHMEGGEKDALRDARSSGVFCVNACPWHLRLAMSASAAEVPRSVDEFDLRLAPDSFCDAWAEKGSCTHINAPCVRNSPLRLECSVIELVALTEEYDVVVVGKVVHAEGSAEDVPLASRGGYFNYFRVAEKHCFQAEREDIVW
eukprot:TRINITY_DN8968_c0_g1_i1.p1 TRINITY_DN8968_c0_g1~~TRINITY_DN8968_c0_g1_i1.p1  ORF type:complete len:443 (-),score=35.67 TRINITY_DN8968_c0_g1_i1:167-1495(-)